MIPLIVRSHYSLMWGTAGIQSLCRQARALGYRRMALTDTDNLYGMWHFIHACRQLGMDPVIGAELTDPEKPYRAVCLVKHPAGYANLCRLITSRHTEKPFDLKSRLPDFRDGLVVLTKNPDLLCHWHDRNVDVAAALTRNPLHGQHPLYRAARTRNRPLVATPGSFFAEKKDHFIHRILRAIDQNTCLSRLTAGDMAPEDAFLMSAAHYRERFAICPEAITATVRIAEELEFKGPDFGLVMPPVALPGGKSPATQLLQDTLAGAGQRYGIPVPEPVRQRIHYEMNIIEKKRFCEYFLVVRDIVRKSTRTCGRGSGAASIVAYCLGITNVCPIKFNLYFERFLNPGRTDPPDIDIDFAWDERDGILSYVLEKFKGHAAMVSSHVLFQPRMAVREVAKVFGLPDSEIKTVSKKLPWFWKQDDTDPALLDQIRAKPEFRFMDFPEPWPAIMACAERLIGVPRYLSVHPGGIVITPEPVSTYVPIQNAPKGVPLMQWEKDSAEAAGLVKIDLLGNRSLGVIRDAVTAARMNTEIKTVFDTAPEDDPDTRKTVAEGNTVGCFYIESPAMRLLQKKSEAGDFEHVVIHSSIIRPAANEFIKEYLRRLHTGIWKPIHPLLEGVLSETFGIMVYQEDVSRVAVALAGFSHEQADGLRKIMSKKDKTAILMDYYAQFEAGAQAKGVSKKEIQSIWKMIISFSGYSFCKPHSASYARVSFQAAFLKTHYPAEFMAAVISNQGGFYSTFAYVSEARRMQLDILPPDVTKSRMTWTGKDRSLQVGLMAVRNLSARTIQAIIREREIRAFADIHDFLSRIHPHEDEAAALIHSGSLDHFDRNRPRMLWTLACRRKEPGPATKEPLLFNPAVRADFPDLPEENAIDRLRREYAVLGFLCRHHPICLFDGLLKSLNPVKGKDLPRFVGKNIRFAGWFLTGKTVQTRHGDPMKFLTFEDETGWIETVFFPQAYARFCHMLEAGRPYLLYGKVESEWNAVTLTVSKAEPISLSALPEPRKNTEL